MLLLSGELEGGRGDGSMVLIFTPSLQVMQITPSDHKRVLAVLPSFHITGLVHVLHLPLLINAEVFFLPAFTMKAMLDTVTEYQIPELLLVPPILIRMVRDPIVEKYDLSCVKRFSSGAAPLSEEIIQLLKKKFPQTGFKQGYGEENTTTSQDRTGANNVKRHDGILLLHHRPPTLVLRLQVRPRRRHSLRQHNRKNHQRRRHRS